MLAVSQSSVRGLARIVAELLLTGAVLLLLLAFYLLVWTNVQTGVAQRSLLEDFRADRAGAADGVATAPAETEIGDGLSVLHIPRLGEDWEWVVLEGVDLTTLEDGPGHFPGTALPGQVGNFAVAGHRATHGEPFAHLDTLEIGDDIVVEAADGWFTYQVTWTRIVSPTSTEVLAPVAGHPGQAPTEHTLTLVTCHPRWGSAERLVVGAQLVEVRDPAAGPPDSIDVEESGVKSDAKSGGKSGGKSDGKSDAKSGGKSDAKSDAKASSASGAPSGAAKAARPAAVTTDPKGSR